MSSSSSGGRLLLDEPAPGVARLTISNPAKRGALDLPILERLTSAMGELDARCVIVTGEGATFSAGYDIAGLSGRAAAGPAPATADGPAPAPAGDPFADALAALAGYPYPTLAALNGHAIGGGLELAATCDLRIAADAVTLGMPPAKLGLVYSETGIRKFIDLVGAARTRELFLVGGRIDAATAHGWGLVNSVVPAAELAGAAVALAREVAANAPLAQQGNKRVIEAVLAARAALPAAVERDLNELRVGSLQSADFREALQAFAEKRAPRWQGG